MSIKLLLVLAAVMALLMLVSRASATRSAGAPPGHTRGSWLSPLVILALRIARALLAVMTLLTAFMAFKFMLIFGASARSSNAGSYQDAWVAGGLLAGIGLLLYFLFWTSTRIRSKVNQLHAERNRSDGPLLAGHWSL